MENLIYTNAIARLKSADALAYYTSKSVSEPKTYEWFTDQVEQALADTSAENKTVAFDFPAIFFEFGPTNYSKGNTIIQDGSGELTVHVAQLTFVDGREDADSHDDFKALLDYADVIIDLLSGQLAGCGVRLIMNEVQRDHTGRAIMCDKIKFSWTGKRKREGVPVV